MERWFASREIYLHGPQHFANIAPELLARAELVDAILQTPRLPKAQICDAGHIRLVVLPISGAADAHVGRHAMTSDYTGIVFFAVLGMLVVLSTVYIPA